MVRRFFSGKYGAENLAMELKCNLFADRISSNLFDANTVKLYLSSFVRVLYIRLRQALAEHRFPVPARQRCACGCPRSAPG